MLPFTPPKFDSAEIYSELAAGNYAIEASRLVSKDRAKTHGPAAENYNKVAALWNAYLEIARTQPHVQQMSPDGGEYDVLLRLTTFDAMMMMALMKIARTQCGEFNEDDFVDAIGYLDLAATLMKNEIG